MFLLFSVFFMTINTVAVVEIGRKVSVYAIDSGFSWSCVNKSLEIGNGETVEWGSFCQAIQP